MRHSVLPSRHPLLALVLCMAMAMPVMPVAMAAPIAPPSHASTSATAATSPADIASAADEIVRVAGDHRLLLLGEMHGTREVPQLATALVAHYSKTQPVMLAVELARHGHAAASTYLASQGSDADRKALRAAPFLQVPDGENDGRRNESLIDMFEALRRLRVDGRDVAILPFDITLSADGADRRDRRMADYLRKAYSLLPQGRLVVVTGNVHAMKARPDFPDAAKFQTPMGSYLLDLQPYAVNVSARAGRFWACMEETCGEQPARSSAATSGPASGPYRNSFDYTLVMPAFSTPKLIMPSLAK